MQYNGWVKMFRKLPLNAKVRKHSSSARYCFVCYVMLAKRTGKWRGYLVDEEGEPITLRDRASYCGVDPSWLCKVDKRFLADGLLTMGSAGRIKVTNYDRYQSGQESDEVEATPPEPAEPEEEDDMDEQQGCPMCRSPKPDTSGVQYLFQQMHDHYLRTKGICPTFVWGKDGSLLKALLKAGRSEDRILELYQWYLRSTDDFIQSHGYDIATFKMKFDAIALAADRGKPYGGYVGRAQSKRAPGPARGIESSATQGPGSRARELQAAISGDD